MPAPRWVPTEHDIIWIDDASLSTQTAANRCGVSKDTMRKVRAERGIQTGVRREREVVRPEVVGMTVRDGQAIITGPPVDAADADAVDGLIRENGLDPAEWRIVSVTINKWNALGTAVGGVNPVLVMRQVKVTLASTVDILATLPAPAPYRPVRAPRHAPRTSGEWQYLVVSDHQAPYTDDRLHQATLAMIRSSQPRKIGHIGDLCDYTSISKHKDHGVVKAAVDECTDAGTQVLAEIRDAAPDSEIEILAGNHDVRPLSELLLRAERMAGIRSGNLKDSPGRQLITLPKLWRLEELGIKYVEDLRGWEHAELEIVPGENGLVAVHGWLTGENVAKRTLAQVGRSVMMGHTHRPEHVFVWNKTIKREQQAMVVGCQCEVRGGGGKHFPTFAPRDGWIQGPAMVTVFADGEFTVQRARWNGTSLLLGADRWSV